MHTKLKTVFITFIWIIFIPIAYSIKILIYLFNKIIKFCIMFNTKIKNY